MLEGFVRSSASVALLRGMNAILGFAVLLVLTRNIGPAELGIYAFAGVLLSLLSIPVNYGWAPLLLRQSAQALHTANWAQVKGIEVTGRVLAAVFTLVFLCIGLSTAWLSPTWWPSSLGAAAVAVLAATFLFEQYSGLRTALLRGLGKPVQGQLPEMIVRPAVLLVTLLALFTFTRSSIDLLVILASLAVATAIANFTGLWLVSKVTPEPLRESSTAPYEPGWTRSAATLGLSAGITIVNAHADVLMLGILDSAESVGHYKVALQVAVASSLAYTSLNMVAAQRFAVASAAADRDELQKIATSGARWSLLSAIPLTVILLAYGDKLVPLLFGEQYAPAIWPMIVLSIAQAIDAGSGMGRNLLTAAGHEDRVAKIALVALAVKVAACFILIPPYGAVGAALASGLALATWNGGLWWLNWKLLSVDTSFVGLRPAQPGRKDE